MTIRIFTLVGLIPCIVFLTLLNLGVKPYQHYPMEIRLFFWPASILYIGGRDDIGLIHHFFAVAVNSLIYAGIGTCFGMGRNDLSLWPYHLLLLRHGHILYSRFKLRNGISCT